MGPLHIFLAISFLPWQYGSRLECLENTGANPIEDENSRWIKGEIDPTRIISGEDFEWIYNDPECPLENFDLENFCINSVGCSNSMLLVGDSTIEYLFRFFTTFYQPKVDHLMCPITFQKYSETSLNYGDPANSRSQLTKRIPTRKIKICEEECGGRPVTLSYFMHDFLYGVHGEFHRQVCDNWVHVAHEFDVLLLSFGAHVASMATHPYGLAATEKSDVSALLEETSTKVAEQINQLVLSKNPEVTVVYLTAGGGHLNYTMDCNEKPDQVNANVSELKLFEDSNLTVSETDNRLLSDFHWSLIPIAQEIYMNTLRTKVNRDNVITLDIQRIQREERECLKDYQHYRFDTLKSPYFIQWQFIHNALSAHNKTYMSIFNDSAAGKAKQ